MRISTRETKRKLSAVLTIVFVLQIRLDRNSTCSKWLDVVDLVRSQDIDIVDEQENILSDAFLERMETYRKASPEAHRGIVWRWVLGQAIEDDGLSLAAQMLPCSISKIEECPELKEEHALGILAMKVPVVYNTLEGSTAPGPVPTFFSNDPEESLKQLKESPEYAFQCMQRLVSRLLARREITRYSHNPRVTLFPVYSPCSFPSLE